MYGEMHAEEEKKGTEGLPPKFSHLEFLVELVHDFIYPEQTKFHVEQLREMYDSPFTAMVRTTRSLYSFRNANNTQCDDWDFSCESGITDYLAFGWNLSHIYADMPFSLPILILPMDQ